MYSNIDSEVNNPNSGNPDKEGLTSVIYALDLENDYFTWSRRLRPLSTIMPSLMHDEYFPILDKQTNDLERLRFVKDDTGSYLPLSEVFKKNPQAGLIEGASITAGFSSNSTLQKKGMRSAHTWQGDVTMAQTQVDDGQAGGSYNVFETPYKSKWYLFSQTATTVVPAVAGFASWHFLGPKGNSIQQGANKVNYGWICVPTQFAKALERQRRIFANNHIMNTLLPKTSFKSGKHCSYLIGNYGEYLTSKKWLEVSETYKDVSWLDSYGNNTQDSHGTFIYLHNNFSKFNKDSDGRLRSRHFVSKQKGYVHNISSEEVYKDFSSKITYCTKFFGNEPNPREEIHFISAMSIGHKTIMKEFQINNSRKIIQEEEWTNPLMFYRKYNINNFNWTVYSDYLKPRIPIANFTGKNIKDSLQDLANVMGYDFGIRNGEPFFEKSYQIISPQTFYYTHTDEIDYQMKSTFWSLVTTDFKDCYFIPEEIKFTNGKYYFVKGEIIFIGNDVDEDGINNPPDMSTLLSSMHDTMTNSDNIGRWKWAYRNVNNSMENENYLNNLDSGDRYITNSVKRRKFPEDILLFEIKSIIDEKMIIDIDEYGRTYDFQEFTDLHLHYGNGKVFKSTIQGSERYKKVLRKDIPFIDNKDWIMYLAKKIKRNVNLNKYKISLSIRLIPSLKYGDYIAIHNEYLKVGETTTINQGGKDNDYKTYELFRISSANHNIESFTTSITAYSVDTTSMTTSVVSGATSTRQDVSNTWAS